MTTNGTGNSMGNISDAADLRPVNQASYGAWIKPTTITPGVYHFVLSRQGSYAIYINNGVLEGEFDSQVVTSSYLPQANVWFHTAITKATDGAIRLYVNGSQMGLAWTNNSGAGVGSSTKIGCDFQIPPQQCFIGQIDNLTLYNGTWSPTQVSAFHTGTQPPATVAYYFEGSNVENLTVSRVSFNLTRVIANPAPNWPPYAVSGILHWKASQDNTTDVAWGYYVNDTTLIDLAAFNDFQTLDDRPGWVTHISTSTPPAYYPGALEVIALSKDDNTTTLAVGFDRAGGDYISCVLILKPIVDEYQCGYPELPPLDSLTVETVLSSGSDMSFQLRHPQTSTDVLLDDVTYEYELSLPILGFQPIQNQAAQTISSDRIVRTWFNTSDWEEDLTNTLIFRARVRDQITNETSAWSCMLTTEVGNDELPVRSCIGRYNAHFGSQGNPSFPFIDVATMAPELGLEIGTFGATLGAMFLLGLVLVSSTFAGPITGIFSGVVGLGFLYSLNLVPTWALVVLFTACLTIILFSMTKGGNSE